MSLLLFDDDDVTTTVVGVPAIGATPAVRDPLVGRLANGSLSLVIDPISRDLIDTADGWFLEETSSRTAVLWQLESTYRAWWGDPSTGSRLRAIIRGDDGVRPLPEELRDEVLRALQPLADDGILADLAVALDRDEVGRPAVIINYRDRASGKPVDLAYLPFGG